MEAPPPLRTGLTEEQYRAHFEAIYCLRPIITPDGIAVRFRKEDFDHCMYESDRRSRIKNTALSAVRAQRVDWIKATLEHAHAELFQGWNSSKKRPDPDRRVAVVYQDYVVVIAVRTNSSKPEIEADFITAFSADNSILKIRSNPRWTHPKRKCR